MNIYRIQTPAKTKSGWRMLHDCRFSSVDAAHSYGLKYWTDRHGAKRFRIVEITDDYQIVVVAA